ncbi:MAG: hypothetical protein JJ899_17635, partial [Alphaproteobacteria bacterium]|nr:hypothetical protein [Alphaproteobacteria bacterium]
MLLLAVGAVSALMPIFASFLPVDLGVSPRHETITIALHIAASICCVGLALAFLVMRTEVVRALAHPMVLAAFFVAFWTVLLAPFSDYPWLSLVGASDFGEGAIRYASLGVFFATAQLLFHDRFFRPFLCLALACISFLAPLIMRVWANDFFVSLDQVGYFAIPAAVGAWMFLEGQDRLVRCGAAGIAALPAFAVSSNQSILAMVALLAFPGAVLAAALLRSNADRTSKVRVAAIVAVIAAPVVGVIAKWLLPQLVSLPSIWSRHLLDKVIFAATKADPSIYAIGQGWGQIPMTVDRHILAAGSVMWDNSWDLTQRFVTHSHSIYSEALLGAGLPAVVGLLVMLAVPIWVVSRDMLPTVIFVTLAVAGMGAVSAELPSTVGAVALAFAIASARTREGAWQTPCGVPGRGLAWSLPVVTALFVSAAGWHYTTADSIRERTHDVRLRGGLSPFACEVHPRTSPFIDNDLAFGLVSAYRPVFEKLEQRQPVPADELNLVSAYLCTAEKRSESKRSPSLHIALETFRTDLALGTRDERYTARFRWAVDDWPSKIARALNAAPERIDIPIGFLADQVRRG